MSAELNKATLAPITPTDDRGLARRGWRRLFRCLAEDAQWTVTGSTPISRIFCGRKDVVDGALKPISALLAGPITPSLVGLYDEGDIDLAVGWGSK
ncbi:MAG: hypothetical protein AAF493_18360 [Pseudomonadota bacterium]